MHEYDSLKERIDKWFLGQNSIGMIEREASFGGISVQRRLRL